MADLFDEDLDSIIEELMRDRKTGDEEDPDEFEAPDSAEAFVMPTAEEAAETAALESTLEMLDDNSEIKIKTDDEKENKEIFSPKKNKERKGRKGLVIAISAFLILLVALTAVAVFVLKPTFDLEGQQKTVCKMSTEYVEPGYSAHYIGIDITDKVEVAGEVDPETPGVYTLKYVLRFLGREHVLNREVTVKDMTLPVITLNGDKTVETHDRIWTDPGVTATDNADGDITDKVEVESEYVEATEGTYKVTYRVTDKAGNTAEAERTVIVFDKTPPEILLIGSSVLYYNVGDYYIEPGATASDNFDLNVPVVTEGAPDLWNAGTYTVTYSAADKAGNAKTVERRIIVAEKPVGDGKGIVGGGVVSDSTIYLTFDDGPSYVTPMVLDVLKEYNVKATFFLVDYSAHPEHVKRAIEEGHTIAIHGYSHDYSIIYVNAEAGLENITKLHDKLVEDFDYATNLTRFPGGSSNTISRNYCEGVMSELCPLAEKAGYNYFDWNISSDDATVGGLSADTIASNVIKGLKAGRSNVVLMHDSYGKDTSAEALAAIIKYGLENGYTFAGLSSDTEPVHHPINN